MFKRYLSVYKRNVALLLLIIILVVVSSYTQGSASKVTAVLAGVAMIYAGISLTVWIIKTPSKKDKDAVV